MAQRHQIPGARLAALTRAQRETGARDALAQDRERVECRTAYLRLGGEGRRGKFGRRRWRLNDAAAVGAKRNPVFELVADCRQAIDAGASEADACALWELGLAKTRRYARLVEQQRAGVDVRSDIVDLPCVIRLKAEETAEQGAGDTAVDRWLCEPTRERHAEALRELSDHLASLKRFVDRVQANYVLGKHDPMAGLPRPTV